MTAPEIKTPSLADIDQPPDWAFRRIRQAEEARRLTRPADFYEPGRIDWPEEDRYQLAFHKSGHIIRAMFPGNGAGKTTVAGIECDYWLQHRHPYQWTPKWKIQVVWVCLKFQQMDLLREQLESVCLTPGWSWNDQKHRYTWPNGSTFTVVSNDGDWSGMQGVNPDLVVVDEECQVKLWRELTMRRRGRKKTRYILSATATRGKRWMFKLIYQPWLQYHDALGLDVEQAMRAQKHPTRWVWPRGGIEDNPAHTPDDLSWYEAELAYATPAERAVRLHGGFHDLNAAPVFHPEGVTRVENTANRLAIIGQNGTFIPATKRRRPQALAEFEFMPTGELYEGGRITIYEPPGEDNYVIGGDFGYGLHNRDWDAAVVLGQKSKRQVAEAHGRWGDVHFAWVLWCLGWYYNEALIVGERQVGLPTLRRLMDEWGYVHLYRDLDEEKFFPRKSDRLGHHKHHGDLVIPTLQWAIAPVEKDKQGRLTGRTYDPVFQFLSPELIHQIRVFEWKPKTDRVEFADTTASQLVCGAPSGEHDDLVMAAAYAAMGWIDLPKYIKQKPVFAAGTLGDKLGHAAIVDPQALKLAIRSPFSMAPKPSGRPQGHGLHQPKRGKQ